MKKKDFSDNQVRYFISVDGMGDDFYLSIFFFFFFFFFIESNFY